MSSLGKIQELERDLNITKEEAKRVLVEKYRSILIETFGESEKIDTNAGLYNTRYVFRWHSGDKTKVITAAINATYWDYCSASFTVEEQLALKEDGIPYGGWFLRLPDNIINVSLHIGEPEETNKLLCILKSLKQWLDK